MKKSFKDQAADVTRWNPNIAARWKAAAAIGGRRLKHKFEPRTSFAQSKSAQKTANRIRRWTEGEKQAAVYGRIGNPETWALEKAVAALQENPRKKGQKIVAASRATSSGMGAVRAMIEGSIKKGDHIVASKHLFGATTSYLNRLQKDFGVKVTYIDGRDPQEWERAARKNTKLFLFETPTNPLLYQIDVKAVSAIAHDKKKGRDILVAVDGSMVSPLGQEILKQGADLYAVSITKYLSRGKHNGGALLISTKGAKRIERLNPTENNTAKNSYKVVNILKGSDALSPANARYFLKQIQTLGPRFNHQSDVAHDLAQYLGDKLAPRGIEVLYPGLKNHAPAALEPGQRAQFRLAQKQMLKRDDGAVIGGGVFTIDCGSKKEAFRIQNVLVKYGASLETNFGQNEFHATHQATNTYATYSPQLRAECGITEGLVRFSPGDAANLEYWKAALAHAFGFTPDKKIKPHRSPQRKQTAKSIPGSEKATQRRQFLAECAPETRKIHKPIINFHSVSGHLNPAGLGNAKKFSRTTGSGQSAVGFETLAAFRKADDTGTTPYGGAEYAIVQSPEADAVCRKMTKLHGGEGAIICSSGLSAIKTALEAFAPAVIAFPEGAYMPDMRYVRWANGKKTRQPIKAIHYSSHASARDMEKLIESARTAHKPIEMIYLEAPCSKTYEIPDIEGIIKLAYKHKIRVVMDNSHATHVRFRPLAAGVDVVIQATTKYEGGYYDTPSGVVIAGTKADLELLQEASRATGAGAVAPETCRRLFHRVDSTEQRLDQHHDTAMTLARWFQKQSFVADVLNPALETSPDHKRFKKYFGKNGEAKGNGLFTVVFKDNVPPEKIDAFIDGLNLFRIAQSWGGHVSLALPTDLPKNSPGGPHGVAVRFHAGLESASDLARDLEQSARLVFDYRPASQVVSRP